MGERADDSWAASDVGLIASRQNGKNGIVEVREGYGLTVLNERIIHTAHQFKTTLESWDRLLALIEDGPLAEELVGKHATPAQGYVMRFRNGGRINFIARSRMSGRGLTGDLLIFDEAQDLDDAAQGALLPTISARPGAQAWYLGSAPGEHSVVFHRIRKRGRAGEEQRLAFFEFSAEPDAENSDRAAWRQANPAFGVRITEEAIEAEFLAMDSDEFARERLSISPEPSELANRIIPLEAWQACLDPDSSPQGPEFFALDVSPSRQWSSIGVAATSRTGTTHVECIEHKTGTDWLVPACVTLRDAWGATIGVASGSPAASLIPDLGRAGVPVVEISTGAHAQACGGFFDAVTQARVTHRGQPSLNVAVDSADRKFYGDSWLWARRTSGEITPLVAVTLAKWLHDQAPPPASGFVDLSDYDD